MMPRTILLVDDEEAIRALAGRILRRRGYNVIEARDGPDAIVCAAAHNGRIDLLISDLVMPGISGPQLADAVWAERPDTNVLLMSGYTEDHARERGLNGHAFLSKPFTPAALVAAVDRLVNAAAA
jgi:CheY-like chemotaxis protein